MERRKSKQVMVGGVPVGGGAPVTVQSMLNVPSTDIPGSVAQAKRLEEAGCQILRAAIPDRAAVALIPAIKEAVRIPLVADIHFDYKLALEAVAAGVDKVRINPGNIGDDSKVEAVAKACREKGAKVILDADGDLLKAGLKASPYPIKPNHHELSALVGRTLSAPEELAETARKVMAEYGIEKVVVSMGGDGALYVTGEETIYAEGLKVPVGSTVGAGDSVVAALAVAEESGMSLEETVRLSTATGAANVMCSGTQAAEYDVIEGLLPKVVFYRM